MAKSYLQLQREIESLQRKADELRSKEVNGVVARIKEAIAQYGLTAEQLGLSGTAVLKSAKAKGKPASAAKYSDGQGNSWGGRGPRPRWLRDAIAAGRSLEDFTGGSRASRRATPSGAASPPPKGRKAAKKVTKKRSTRTTYANAETGQTWSGMGPRPAWLKAALAAGSDLAEFAA